MSVPEPPETTLPRSRSIVAQHESLDTEVVESKEESAEYRAIRECFADLTGAATSGILNPGWLAVQLYSKKLIENELLTETQKQAVEERVKAVKLLSAVRDQIATSPATKFREFLDVLQNERSLQHLATRLENTRRKLSGQVVPPPVFIQSNPVLTQFSPPLPHTSSPHPQDLPNPPPSKRPKTDNAFQSLEHVVQDFQQCQKDVFLLFEGFDELPEELRTNGSIFLDLITGKELPEATVLITSRPWASEFLHWGCRRHISQHIQILGFTQANIQSYLESTMANDPLLLADLKKYISCYPHINSLMYIPLNCAIVVEVYRNSRKDESLVPKTMTELYSSLVRSLLLRHLFDHPVHGKKRRWRIRSFSDLPPDVYQQLCELGRIAYEGIVNRQQVIFSDLPVDFETLGLMQCAPELYVDEGTAVSYNFLHLTVQEYLAAFHLSLQSVEKQIRHFKKHWVAQTHQLYYDDRPSDSHFQVVLRFLSGIRKFSGYSNEMVDLLQVNSDSVCVVYVNLTILHWLFEAQDNDVIAKLLGSSEVDFIRCPDMPTGYVVTPFDCFVLGYCVSQSNCTWKIWLGRGIVDNDCCIGDEGLEMLVHGTVEGETHCTGKISLLDLNESGITFEVVKHLLTFPKQLINRLGALYLENSDTVYHTVCNNQLDSGSCATLAHLIPHIPHLKKLGLSDNPNIGQGGAVALITALTAHNNSLEQLWLYETGIGVEDCKALSELLSSSRSLKELDINSNDLPPEAVELIISGLHLNTTLTKLNMNFSYFSLQNTISLASVLRTNHTLVCLNLIDCEM